MSISMRNLKKAGCGSVIDTHIHFPSNGIYTPEN